ncbi:MAG: hypothetical protein ABEJ23_01895 [Haloarculaceae archaeon]
MRLRRVLTWAVVLTAPVVVASVLVPDARLAERIVRWGVALAVVLAVPISYRDWLARLATGE